MKTYFLLALIILITSCSSYNGNAVAYYKYTLKPEEAEKLDGIYELNANKVYLSNGLIDSCAVAPNDILNGNLRMIAINDSISKYQMRIQTLGSNQIKSTLIKNGDVVDSSLIKGKITKKGMFHFRNNPVDCYGIPYILGGCSGSKTRIGIDYSGNLIVQNVSYSGGALLLLIGDGRSYSSAYNFKKIKSE